jgi:arylsulfatase A-like enzyme
MKYPEEIEANQVSTRTIGSVDLLPTLCHLAGVPLPENEIDGENVWELITGSVSAENPHEYYAFSNASNFEGVMSGDGKWKLHLPHGYRIVETDGADGIPGKYGMAYIDTALFDMGTDPFETTNVISENPEVAAELIRLASEHASRFYNKP